MCSFQITLHIEEPVHTTPGLKSGGEGVKDHFSQKGEKWLKKWLLSAHHPSVAYWRSSSNPSLGPLDPHVACERRSR